MTFIETWFGFYLPALSGGFSALSRNMGATLTRWTSAYFFDMCQNLVRFLPPAFVWEVSRFVSVIGTLSMPSSYFHIFT